MVHPEGTTEFRDVALVTFDCYGTLVDWESGIGAALETILKPRGVEATRDQLLARFAHHEERTEAGPYRAYREVLAEVADAIAAEHNVVLSPRESAYLAESLPDWPVFDDTVAALERLAGRYLLGILSNVDDDLLAGTARHLGVNFATVVTAQQVGSYKPARANFEALLERVDVAPTGLLHAAQSLFHDVAPASAMGLATVWVDRRGGKKGGATPASAAVPDQRVESLRALADLLCD